MNDVSLIYAPLGFLTNVVCGTPYFHSGTAGEAKPELFLLMVLLGHTGRSDFHFYPMSTIVIGEDDNTDDVTMYCSIFRLCMSLSTGASREEEQPLLGFLIFIRLGEKGRGIRLHRIISTLHRPGGISSFIL